MKPDPASAPDENSPLRRKNSDPEKINGDPAERDLWDISDDGDLKPYQPAAKKAQQPSPREISPEKRGTEQPAPSAIPPAPRNNRRDFQTFTQNPSKRSPLERRPPPKEPDLDEDEKSDAAEITTPPVRNPHKVEDAFDDLDRVEKAPIAPKPVEKALRKKKKGPPAVSLSVQPEPETQDKEPAGNSDLWESEEAPEKTTAETPAAKPTSKPEAKSEPKSETKPESKSERVKISAAETAPKEKSRPTSVTELPPMPVPVIPEEKIASASEVKEVPVSTSTVSTTALTDEYPLSDESAKPEPSTAESPLKKPLSTLERSCLIAFAVLLLGGGLFLYHALHKLPAEHKALTSSDFPIKGGKVEALSFGSYWRAPIASGEGSDNVRRGTVLLPVIELQINGGPGAIRIFFRNSNGELVGDPVTRAVNGAATLKIPASAGFDDLGMHAAYRAGNSKPWIVEILEGPSTSAPGDQFKKLFEIPISTERR